MCIRDRSIVDRNKLGKASQKFLLFLTAQFASINFSYCFAKTYYKCEEQMFWIKAADTCDVVNNAILKLANLG